MTKKLILCALAGAVAAQIWLMISWMVIPWHFIDFKQFSNDSAVAESVANEANGPGVYMLPNYDTAVYEDEALMKDHMDRLAAGPYAFMIVRPNGVDHKMAPMFIRGFLINMFIAGVLFWLLSFTSITNDKTRILFMTVAGSVGALAPLLAHWNWWYFPTMYTLVLIIDVIIQWAVVSFAMCKIRNRLA